MEKKLTIGMAHFSDYHGVYFTIQDIYKELVFNGRRDLLNQIEIVVVENNASCPHAREVKNLAGKLGGLVRVVDLTEKQGTSCARNKIIEEARGQFVLVMDCHIMLCPVVSTIERLIQFINYNSKSDDLYCGPLLYDSLGMAYTHFNNEWGGGMWGRWGTAWQCVCEAYNFSVYNENDKCVFVDLATQEKITKCKHCGRNFPEIDYAGHEHPLSLEGYSKLGLDPKNKPFEVFAQGLGLFLTRKNAWLGFSEKQSGFGGEECYIHEKYRRAGRKTMCLPFLKWIHRFGRPEGVQYSVSRELKLQNYVHEFKEIGLDPAPLKHHFVEELGVPQEDFDKLWNEGERKISIGFGAPSEENLQAKIEKLQKQLTELQGKDKKCCAKNKQRE